MMSLFSFLACSSAQSNDDVRELKENEVKEYDIKIKNVDYYTAKVNKGIVIEITD